MYVKNIQGLFIWIFVNVVFFINSYNIYTSWMINRRKTLSTIYNDKINDLQGKATFFSISVM